MLSTHSIIALSFPLLAFAALTPIDSSFLTNVVSGKKYIKFPVQTIRNDSVSSLHRRQNDVGLTSEKAGTFYLINCKCLPVFLP
jgi:hypothetical protein